MEAKNDLLNIQRLDSNLLGLCWNNYESYALVDNSNFYIVCSKSLKKRIKFYFFFIKVMVKFFNSPAIFLLLQLYFWKVAFIIPQ